MGTTCFVAGDGTYGRPTDLPWAAAYLSGVVPIDVPVHPTELYEAAGAFAIAALLWALDTRWRPVSVFGAYLVLTGLARLLVEFVRINDPVVFGLTQPQLFGIASMIIGAALILRDSRRARPASADLGAVPATA